MLAAFAAPLLALALLAPAPLAGDGDREKYIEERRDWAIKAGQRHLEYGVQLRREGLCVQAASQIVLAVEVSEARNHGANMVLRLMQDLDDRFWKKNAPRATVAKIDAYSKGAKKLALQHQKERLELASWAWSHQLWEEAHAEYLDILKKRDEPLVFDSAGRLAIEGGTLPEKESERIREEAVDINGQLYVRDRFLYFVPQIKRIFEKRTSELCVRSTKSLEEAEKTHALVLQLLPVLKEDIGASPTLRLYLVLLDDVKHYDTYLDTAQLSEHKSAVGFCDRIGGIAIVCTAKTTEGQVPGLCLHEMVHQFHYAVSRAAMPSWYDEGLAETYGGQGTWTMNEGKLTLGGMMPKERLAPLLAEQGAYKLRDLLQGSAIDVLSKDELRARLFYAQSWAFVRYLRTGGGEELAKKFAHWETTCRGALVGADIVGMPSMKKSASNDLFLKMFNKDLPKLEDGFFAWLAKQ